MRKLYSYRRQIAEFPKNLLQIYNYSHPPIFDVMKPIEKELPKCCTRFMLSQFYTKFSKLLTNQDTNLEEICANKNHED